MTKKIPYISNFMNHPRMLISAAFGVVSLYILRNFFELRTIIDMVLAWDIGAVIYIFLSLQLFFAKGDKIITRAKHSDENEWVILFICSCAAISSIAAIVGVLAAASKLFGVYKLIHIGLAVFTLLISWIFIHIAFTLHYAHQYYSHRGWLSHPSLIFPDTKEPNYTDFLYFSFVIGTSGQTADVCFGSTDARRIGMIHCILSYLFNATILALMINIAASLIGD